MSKLTDFKPLSVSQRVEWHDKGPFTDLDNKILDDYLNKMSYATVKTFEYVKEQIELFLKENRISVKNWKKRGIIQSLPPELGGQSYILHYKTWRREVRRKITVEYNLITER